MKIISEQRWNALQRLLETPDGRILHTKLRDVVRNMAAPPTLDIANLTKKHGLYIAQNTLLLAPLAYRLDGTPAARDVVIRLVQSLQNRAWLCDAFPKEIHWGYLIAGVSAAYDMLEPDLTDVERQLFHDLAHEMFVHISEQSQKRNWGDDIASRAAWNHTVLPFSGLTIAALVFNDLPDAAKWRDVGMEKVKGYIQYITSAGMTWEGLYYCGFVMRNVGLCLAVAENTGYYDITDPLEKHRRAKLAAIPKMYHALQLPAGGLFQNINDSHMFPKMALYGFLSATQPHNPSGAGTVWWHAVGPEGDNTRGHDPTLVGSSLYESMLWFPGPMQDHPWQATPYHCSEYGLTVDHHETVHGPCTLTFNCGPHIGTVHDQSDNNHFALTVGAVPLLLDGGYSNQPKEGSLASSFGHNLVLIDGKGQFPAGRGKGINGRIAHLDRSAERFYVVGDATDSYTKNNYNPVSRHLRHLLMEKGPHPYVVCFDDIEKPDNMPAEFDFLFHTLNPQAVRWTGDSVTVTLAFGGQKVKLRMTLPCGIEEMGQSYVPGPGVSPFKDHTVWRAKSGCNHNPLFVTVFQWGQEVDLQDAPTFRAVRNGNNIVELYADHASRECERWIFKRSAARNQVALAEYDTTLKGSYHE